jgi:hypothetical protein
MRGNYGAGAVLLSIIAVLAIGIAMADDEIPPAKPAPAPPAKTDDAAGPPSITVFSHTDVDGVLGKEVRSANNENMGRIIDVIVDKSGQVRAAIIDFGGFLGVGSRKIAVDWNALRFSPDAKKADHITLELTVDQVKAAPEYKEGKPVTVLGTLGKLDLLPF